MLNIQQLHCSLCDRLNLRRKTVCLRSLCIWNQFHEFARDSEIWCQLLLITNRKWHGLSIDTDLDDLEWSNSPYFAFLPNLIALLANYITVVEDSPIMSKKYCLPVLVFHFWP